MVVLADVTSIYALQKNLHEVARLEVVSRLQPPAVPMLTSLALQHHQRQARPTNYQVCGEHRIDEHFCFFRLHKHRKQTTAATVLRG